MPNRIVLAIFRHLRHHNLEYNAENDPVNVICQFWKDQISYLNADRVNLIFSGYKTDFQSQIAKLWSDRVIVIRQNLGQHNLEYIPNCDQVNEFASINWTELWC